MKLRIQLNRHWNSKTVLYNGVTNKINLEEQQFAINKLYSISDTNRNLTNR